MQQHHGQALNDEIRFTTHAAARAFEHDLDHAEVLAALAAEHFKQPAVQGGTYVHYVKVAGRPVQVVTGPSVHDPDETVIITLLPLEVGRVS